MENNEVMTMEEFFSEMQEKGLDGTSQYQLRNEAIQDRSKTGRFNRLKREKKKKSKLMFTLELAIPFNPMTGVADETYNADKKFRPTQSATTVALMLKKHVNNKADIKEVFAKRAGISVDEWDTSEENVLTGTDKLVFGKYRVPRIFTFPVVHIDIPVMTGAYGRDYTIDVKRDPLTGEILGEPPMIITANRFFKAVCYEELEVYNKKLENKEIDHTEKQQKEERSKIFSKNPTSDEHPVNWLLAVELPLDNSYNLRSDVNLATIEQDNFKDNLVIVRQNKAIKEALEKYANGSYAKYDRYFDFWEVDMACPTEGETPAELGQGTSYEKPSEQLYEMDAYDGFFSAYRAYTDADTDLEKVIISSVRISPYNEQVENQLVCALPSVIDVDSPYLTKKVIDNYKDFLTLVLGDAGDSLLLDVEFGTSDKGEGVYEEKTADKAAKEALDNVDLDSMLADEIDLDSLDDGMSLAAAMGDN